jgi:Spy/CpxP family protein refolding chaperone
MLKSKFSALLSLLLVFMSGVLVGGFAYRLYNVSVVAAPNSGRRPDPEEARRHIVADMRDHLKLDGQQVNQLQQIFDLTRDQFRQIHDRMNAEGRAVHTSQVGKIKTILRADQMPLYDQWQAERERDRERDRKQHKQGEKK